MQALLNDVFTRPLSENSYAVFYVTFSEDDLLIAEGGYFCEIFVHNYDSLDIKTYWRQFKPQNFERDFKTFVMKFCSDPAYRELFNSDKDIYSPCAKKKDAEIKAAVDWLESVGFIVEDACQGTKKPWRDRPSIERDGHNILAYIIFSKNFPLSYGKILERIGGQNFDIYKDAIYAKKRSDNPLLPALISRSLMLYSSKTEVF